jgi:N-methylhydantoinase A
MGIDTGGTFTDFIFKDKDAWGIYKILSTPTNPADAVIEGMLRIAGDRMVHAVHGSTVATNALLERKGAVTALVTNKGFEDVLEIGRQHRLALYQFARQKPPPLIPKHLRFGLPCRVDRGGNIVHRLNKSDLESLACTLKEINVESIAISFLFSFLNPRHEKTVKRALSKLNLPISLSHEILAEFREYERTSTTACNAYVQPKMASYLSNLVGHRAIKSLRIMQSNGGSISAKTASHESVRTILSGPAGGVVGAYEVGKCAGYDKLITFDMGGTSTDVALVNQGMSLATETTIAQLPLKVPTLDIHTVGAGGGSIAALDPGGGLKVGPESAGASPGPICYGKGEQVTVTDANLFLGRLLPDYFLGGHLQLQQDSLGPYFKSLSKKLGITELDLAEGIIAIANTAMERAIRVISVERGFNPGEFTLIAFGGGGGLHAADLAKLLGMPRVLIPQNPGILSAIGMLMADIIKDYSQTVMKHQDTPDNVLDSLFRPLEKKGQNALYREGVKKKHIQFKRYLDMRYQGQSFEIIVPFEANFLSRFHDLHKKTYGHADRKKPAEIVTLRLRARGYTEKSALQTVDQGGVAPEKTAQLGNQPVYFEGKPQLSKILQRDKLLAGNIINGPAIVVEYSSTIVIPPFATGNVDEYGNIIMSLG